MGTQRNNGQSHQCQVCGKRVPLASIIPAALVRPSVAETIKKQFPTWNADGYICIPHLTTYRLQHVEEILQTERGALSALEQNVVKGLHEHEILTKDMNAEYDKSRKLGERVADRLASFGGSWKFLGAFSVIITAWIIVNAVAFFGRPFDPYPFIFLNLILSCVAALQAPVIMMSQNRQEARDRLRAENEFRVNLKAELEIRLLTEKIDHLIAQQWQRLVEIQAIQLDMLDQVRPRQQRRKVSINDVIGRSA
ncbi:MAG: DUF1003 domain-containing protein [Chloroflexi bacterium]|nr:DUF1003 domain-containing protein [Chloroflexota bacterium]